MTYILVDVYNDGGSFRLFAVKDEDDAQSFVQHMTAWRNYDHAFDWGSDAEFIYFSEWMQSHGYPDLPLTVLSL